MRLALEVILSRLPASLILADSNEPAAECSVDSLFC